MALDLPEHARRSIAEWRDRVLAGDEGVRPVPTASLHVTLCFLGWRAEKDIPLIAETTSGACSGLEPVRLAARGLQLVPPRRPRLFALDLEDADDRASALQGGVGAALAAARMFEPERRPFWPHVTLARVKRDRQVGSPAAQPPSAPATQPPPPPAKAFEASEVTLYRSTLRPQGALYEPLARTVLGG